MNFGMRGHDFEADNLEAVVLKCKKYGIKNLQLVLKKSIPDFKEGNFSPEYASKIGALLKKNEITVSVLGCYINPSDTNPESLNKSLEYFVENLHYAKYIGADMVGLETGFVGEELDTKKNSTEEAYQYLLKNMRYLVKEAQRIGVNIGIEGVHCFVINTPEKMKRLVDDLDSPNVKVIFDPVNYLNYENYKEQNEIIENFFSLLGNKASVLHLKDFKIENGNVSYEYPTLGLLNIDLIFKKIKELKQPIPIILEEIKENKLPDTVYKLKKYI